MTPSKRRGRASTVVALVVGIAIGLAVPPVRRFVDSVKNESAVRALASHVTRELLRHHSEHGSYPLELTSLAIDFSALDGATRETLRLLDYESDGTLYVLTVYDSFGSLWFYEACDGRGVCRIKWRKR